MRESRTSERLGPLCCLPDVSMPASCRLSRGSRSPDSVVIAVPLCKGVTLSQCLPSDDGCDVGVLAPQEYLVIVRPLGPAVSLLLWVSRCPQRCRFPLRHPFVTLFYVTLSIKCSSGMCALLHPSLIEEECNVSTSHRCNALVKFCG